MKLVAFALIVGLSGNVVAQKKPFLVLDIYAKAVTAAERDPLVPIEQDLAKGREPKIPQGLNSNKGTQALTGFFTSSYP
jgi:hypothetical protein